MIKLLIKKFVKDYENIEDKKVRESYGVLSGVIGIICNIVLFLIKIFIGITINSIAIISDAFNNLTDIGSSAIAVLSAKMSNLPPDEDHPMGHGRIEYVSSLAVSFLVLLVGFQLIVSSIKKIINPEKLEFDPVLLGILAISIIIKVWMYSYNKYIGDKIDSSVNKATAVDSISDVFSTLAVVIATVVGHFLPVNIDGLIGAIVSALILYTGFTISRETVNLLLGLSPDPKLVREIKNIVESGEFVMGTHEIQVHDYGPGRRIASVHAEVPDTVDLAEAHASIDDIEEEISEKLNIDIVVHMDPILTDSEKVLAIKKEFIARLRRINPGYRIQSFRVTNAKKRTNVIFDLILPPDMCVKNYASIVKEIKELINEERPDCFVVVNNVLSINEQHVNIV